MHHEEFLIVFDLDGTLIDSRQDLAESTNEMLESYGAPALPIDEVAGFVGEGARVLVQRALAASGRNPDEPDALDRFRSIYDRRLLIHTRPYAGIREVVEAAAPRAALAVLTNKPEAPSRTLLDAFDLSSYFRWVIGGDSGFPRKPDPAGLLHLISAAGASPSTTLVVGDSMIDVQTARAAGARACVALFGFGHLRGGLALTDNELGAKTPADVGRAIETFLALLRPSA
jgi:phosphoglycolate phosphatase